MLIVCSINFLHIGSPMQWLFVCNSLILLLVQNAINADVIFTYIGADWFSFLVLLTFTTVHFWLSCSTSLSQKMPSGFSRRKNMLTTDHLHVLLSGRARICIIPWTRSRKKVVVKDNTQIFFYNKTNSRGILNTNWHPLVSSYVYITWSLQTEFQISWPTKVTSQWLRRAFLINYSMKNDRHH